MVSLARELEHLASLLEAKTKKPRGLKHPRHAQHVAPARKRIKAVLVHFFERQRAAVLKAVKPHIARHLISYPVPVREAYDPDEPRNAKGEWGGGGAEWEDPDEHPWRTRKGAENKSAEQTQTQKPEQKERSGLEKAVDAIRSEMENENYQHYGIRVMGDTKEGAILKRSHVWVDGEYTSKLLPGTSAVEVTRSHIADRIEKMRGYEGQGGKLVLLGSDKITDGQDAHEVVMSGARVIKIFDLSDVLVPVKEARHAPERTLRRDVDVPLREATSTQGRTFASSLLPHSLQPLSFAATGAEESAYNDAITTLIGAAAKSLDASAAVGEDFAGEYLRDNSLSKLTGGINETSIERLQDALAGAWDKGGDYDSMVKAVTDTFDDFSTTRTELIAQTEANDAYNDGRHSIAIGLDMDEKRWDPDGTAACEEICQPNADQGWIPIDEDFQSGDDAPSGHPRCDCSTDYRKSSE